MTPSKVVVTPAALVRSRPLAATILLTAAGSFWLILGPLPRWIGSAFPSMRWKDLGGRAYPEAPVVRQRHTWDCGYAALATLLSGEDGSDGEKVYDSLRAILPLRVGGASVADLSFLAQRFGRSLEARYATDSSWARSKPPYLLLLTERHYIEVVRAEGDSVTIADPEIGGVKLPVRHLLGIHPLVILTASRGNPSVQAKHPT